MKYILEHPVRGTIGSEKFLTTVHWRNGVLVTDEPEKQGGKDRGPDPYTLLLASLITCTLATLKMYTDHKEIPMPEIRVSANMFQKIGNEGTAMVIERHIEISSAVDDDLRQRLMRVAENCPVSKILKGSISIATRLSDAVKLAEITHRMADQEANDKEV